MSGAERAALTASMPGCGHLLHAVRVGYVQLALAIGTHIDGLIAQLPSPRLGVVNGRGPASCRHSGCDANLIKRGGRKMSFQIMPSDGRRE